MIRSIRLREFRCFGSFDFSLPRWFTAVYGSNGSGKTSLIESVRFLKRTVEGRIPLSDLALANIMAGSEEGMSVSFGLAVSGWESEYGLDFSPSGVLTGEHLVCGSEHLHVLRGRDGPVVETEGRADWLPEPELMVGWGDRTLLSLVSDTFAGSGRPLVPMLVAEHIRRVYAGPEELLGSWGALRGSDIFNGRIPTGSEGAVDAFANAVRRFLTKVTSDVDSAWYDFSGSGDGTTEYTLMSEMFMYDGAHILPFETGSTGFRSLVLALPALLACADGRPTFVDGLDAGVHPKLSRDILLQVMPDMRGQLVATLHNVEMLNRLKPGCAYSLEVDACGERHLSRIVDMESLNRNLRLSYMRGGAWTVPVSANVDMPYILDHFREDLDPDGGKG